MCTTSNPGKKYSTDVAVDDEKKSTRQNKKKITKKSSIRFPEKMKYNSCVKDMKLDVLDN